MQDPEQIFFKNRNDFRDWLKENHDKSPGIWMIYNKKSFSEEGVKYREALEESICFGWIDSLIKKVDEKTYLRKFTPRTNIANWSATNLRIAKKMLEKGLMTEAGLSKIDIYVKTGNLNLTEDKVQQSLKKEWSIPEFILTEFSKHEPALQNFLTLAPSHQKHYVLWITDAKREETRQKRLNEAVALLLEKKKLGLR